MKLRFLYGMAFLCIRIKIHCFHLGDLNNPKNNTFNKRLKSVRLMCHSEYKNMLDESFDTVYGWEQFLKSLGPEIKINSYQILLQLSSWKSWIILCLLFALFTKLNRVCIRSVASTQSLLKFLVSCIFCSFNPSKKFNQFFKNCFVEKSTKFTLYFGIFIRLSVYSFA